MASERKIAANRANAAKSTGPRTVAGKKRAARNSLSHGLAIQYSGAEFTRLIEQGALRIVGDIYVGDIYDEGDLELGRTAAEAELDLARVRRVKVGLIERVSALGGLVPPKYFRTAREENRWFRATLRFIVGLRGMPLDPILINPADTMPLSVPDRTAEAARRILPKLINLQRYERRAVARRDRAIKALILRRSARTVMASDR
jgi:hypothetical protein